MKRMIAHGCGWPPMCHDCRLRSVGLDPNRPSTKRLVEVVMWGYLVFCVAVVAVMALTLSNSFGWGDAVTGWIIRSVEAVVAP